MPASDIEQTFGPRGADVDVILPRSFSSGNMTLMLGVRMARYCTKYPSTEDGRCVLTFSTKEGSDRIQWVQMYYAATDLVSACVRQRKGGSLAGFGE